MKKTMMLGTLAGVLALAGPVQAAPVALQDAVITASYNGQAGAMLGLDQNFDSVPGSNVSGLDPTSASVEFFTSDFLFGFDFSADGLLTVMSNGPIAPGSYSARFDFGATLDKALSGISFVGGDIAGLPLLTLIDSHTIGLDFSGVTWASDFSQFSVQLQAADAGAVPEPAAPALLLLGLAGAALARRYRAS